MTVFTVINNKIFTLIVEADIESAPTKYNKFSVKELLIWIQ